MIETRLTQMFGIEKPIIQGGMQWIGIPEFASEVCNAGGMGTINLSIYANLEEFGNALDQMNELTCKPYIVNISLTPEQIKSDDINKYVDVCISHGVAAIEFAGANPMEYLPKVKQAGIRVFHKSPNNHVAQSMVGKGADIITIAGYEVAGHPSMDGIGTFVMSNIVSRSCGVPVLAAGGIADGRGLAAALSLGCAGVVMGTRFVCTDECPVSQNHKQWIIDHNEKDTVITQRTINNANRVANNVAAKLTLEMEARGTTLGELMSVISGKLGKAAYATGDIDGAVFSVGPAIGLIHDVKPVADLMDGMVEEAESILSELALSIR